MFVRTLRLLLVALAALFGLLTPASAQNWPQRYDAGALGNDVAHAVATDTANNIYVAGKSLESGDTHHITLLKYSPGGTLLWERTFAGLEGDNYPRDIVVKGAYVYVVGRMYSGPANDYDSVTLKYNTSGTLLWSRTYDGFAGFDEGTRVAVDRSDNIYVSGRSVGAISNLDYITIKYSPSGGTLWAKRFDGELSGDESPIGIALDTSGNAYVTGAVYRASPTLDDIHVIKYRSSDGAALWSKYYNGDASGSDYPVGIATSPDGSFYVAGLTYGGSVTGNDIVTLRYDAATGNPLWSRRFYFSRNSYDAASALAVDGSGSVYVTGMTGYHFGSAGVFVTDYVTLKYDAAGTLKWRQNHWQNDTNYAQAIAVTGAGGVYVTGITADPLKGSNILTLRYDSDGTLEASALYDGPGSRSDYVAYDRALAVDSTGSAIVVGSAFVAPSDSDIVTLKYIYGSVRPGKPNKTARPEGPDR